MDNDLTIKHFDIKKKECSDIRVAARHARKCLENLSLAYCELLCSAQCDRRSQQLNDKKARKMELPDTNGTWGTKTLLADNEEISLSDTSSPCFENSQNEKSKEKKKTWKMVQKDMHDALAYFPKLAKEVECPACAIVETLLCRAHLAKHIPSGIDCFLSDYGRPPFRDLSSIPEISPDIFNKFEPGYLPGQKIAQKLMVSNDELNGTSVVSLIRIASRYNEGTEIIQSLFTEDIENAKHEIVDEFIEKKIKAGTNEIISLINEETSRRSTLKVGTGPVKEVELKSNRKENEQPDHSRILNEEILPDYVFKRREDFWIIIFRGKQLHLKKMDGLFYIQFLLKNPGEEIKILNLYYTLKGKELNPKNTKVIKGMLLKHSEDEEDEPEISTAEMNHIDSLDPTAKENLKEKLVQLKLDREEAEENADLATIERINRDTKIIEKELLNSRFDQKKKSQPEEKARKNVSRRVRTALKILEKENSLLSKYLYTHLKIGYICCYNPDPLNPIMWEF